MTTHGDYSSEAGDRARRTVGAAAVFADNAELIIAELPEVPEQHILVAVVTDGLQFGGLYYVDELELVARVPELEQAHRGWAMVFSRDSSLDDVRRRSDRMAALAGQRAEAIDRINARRQSREG
jgi:hypothetical protein